MKFLVFFLIINSTILLNLNAKENILNFTGFLDSYYVYDFNKPNTIQRQDFLFNHNRHNEFNINLALFKVNIEEEKYKVNLAFHTGTYAIDNFQQEPGLLKNINEANIAISLNSNNNLWLETGVLTSHIGFESAISSDNPTLTRSLFAENSPYFLTGARLIFNKNTNWTFSASILNGWQRIQRLEGNSLPSFGTQVLYTPNEDFTLNWSTFIGTDDPDSTRRLRYFNDIYGIIKVNNKFEVILGFDIGFQQLMKNSDKYDIWFCPTLIGKYIINEKLHTALRFEYYNDSKEVIISTISQNGFNTGGVSINLDYLINPKIIYRIEGRLLQSANDIFISSNSLINSNFFIASSFAIKI